MPSARNVSVRCRRCIPTARAIPISERRSAASITKIRKISSTPEAIANSPKIRKNVTKIEPTSSPAATAPLFVSATAARPSGLASRNASMRSSTASLRSSVPRTPPAIEIAIADSLPSRPVSSRAASRLTTMPPPPPPAVIEVSRITPITSSAVGSPRKYTSTLSPAAASSSSARSSER